VILPGLDHFMPEEDWRLVGRQAATEGVSGADSTARSHPQYGLHHLLERIGCSRADVQSLGNPSEDLEARSAVFSTAFLPAQATAGWNAVREALDPDHLGTAFRDVSLVEAANEREEAMAIAIA